MTVINTNIAATITANSMKTNARDMETSMEPDFTTGNIRYKARERYSFGFSDWRGIYGSQGA